MSSAALVDSFGRVATDLRVSLTDRCNLRCSYCMPAEGLDWLPTDEVLTDDEVVRLITIAVEQLGVREVRFTGGEPLLRRGLADIVRRTTALAAAARDVDHDQRAGADPHRARRWRRRASTASTSASTPCGATDFHTITRRDRFARRRGRAGGGAGRRAGPRQGQRRAAARHQRRPGARAAAAGAWTAATSSASSSRCRWTRSTSGAATAWSPPRRSSTRCARRSVLEPAEEPRGSAPAELFAVDGGPHTVGVIASVTRPFCGDCDRVRLTADGQVRNCLFAREESDLRVVPARRCGRRRRSPSAGVPRCSGSVPGTASTTRRSSSRRGRCPPSAAEPAPNTPGRSGPRTRRAAACSCQNGDMRLFTAVVPPREVLDEVPAGSPVGQPAVAGERRGQAPRPAAPGRRGFRGATPPAARPVSTKPEVQHEPTTPELDAPEIHEMYIPIAGFGNVTLGRLREAARTPSVRRSPTWAPPELVLRRRRCAGVPGRPVGVGQARRRPRRPERDRPRRARWSSSGWASSSTADSSDPGCRWARSRTPPSAPYLERLVAALDALPQRALDDRARVLDEVAARRRREATPSRWRSGCRCA